MTGSDSTGSVTDGPAATTDGGAHPPTRRQLRLQQVAGRAVAPAVGPAPGSDATGEAPAGPSGNRGSERAGASAVGIGRTPLPGGRRDRRRQQAGRAAGAPVSAVGGTTIDGTPADPLSADARGGRRPEDVSVEEALAARDAIAADAGDHVVALQAAGTDDPFRVDLEVLAQQKALAERAAALNARGLRVQELAEPSTPAPNDPTSAHNLSIVAPPEFVTERGGSRSVLRAPATSFVPVVLPLRAAAPADPSPAPAADGDRADAAPPRHPSEHGTEPVRARNAFGLEPLDAMTAGLGRLRRVRYLQYSLLGVGAATLSTGIVLTVSSLNG